MHKRSALWTGLAGVAVTALTLTGCSATTGTSSSGGGDSGRGPITFASGKDFTSEMQAMLDIWNDKHPGEEVTLLELSASPDDQRTSFVQNFQAQSDAYDVLWSDVVWTSEFASRGWLEELDRDRFGGDQLLPAAVATAEYDGKLYGAPFISNGGLLFYRSDLVPEAPTTWEDLLADCEIAKANSIDCYAGQFAQYEGLTVNAAEAINSAGGSILSDDGTTVEVDSPEARAGLQFLVDSFTNGVINAEAITYKEEESRRAFVEGRLLFLRNWPYVYTSASADDSVIKGKFGVAPLPGADGPGVSSLGGIDLVVSAFSKHKETAKDWIEYMQSTDNQRKVVSEMNQASVVTELYDAPELVEVSPYLPTLKASILNAQKRPATPNYNAVTLAIQENVYAALQGDVTVDEAITGLAADLEDAIK